MWGGVDSYSASQLTDTLSVRLSLQPLTLGKLAASCKWLVVRVYLLMGDIVMHKWLHCLHTCQFTLRRERKGLVALYP